jgi:hypothetical protein
VLPVALGAIYGLVAAGLERNLCFLAATSADGRIHLAGSAAFILAGRTAGRTAFWLIGKTRLLEILLISGAEYKCRAGIRTHKRLILKIHYYLFPSVFYFIFAVIPANQLSVIIQRLFKPLFREIYRSNDYH